MDRGLYNLVIFLDLQMAFDTVNHVLLLGKLEACGIRDNALNPSGFNSGSTFLLVYINDLPNCLKHTTPRMFADDTSLTAYGKSIEEIELGPLMKT